MPRKMNSSWMLCRWDAQVFRGLGFRGFGDLAFDALANRCTKWIVIGIFAGAAPACESYWVGGPRVVRIDA